MPGYKVPNVLPKIKKVKILTYNVWFDNHNFWNRVKAILEIIKNSDANIVCLQECTQDFFNALTLDKEITSKYMHFAI